MHTFRARAVLAAVGPGEDEVVLGRCHSPGIVHVAVVDDLGGSATDAAWNAPTGGLVIHERDRGLAQQGVAAATVLRGVSV